MMLCKNGLHEIDPDDPWRCSNGARCRECCRARYRKYRGSEKGRAATKAEARRGALKGRHAEAQARYAKTEKGRAARERRNERRRVGGPNYARERAGEIARKRYGLSLRQIEREGLLDLYPRVKEALSA
jgi:hypothetical protein